VAVISEVVKVVNVWFWNRIEIMAMHQWYGFIFAASSRNIHGLYLYRRTEHGNLYRIGSLQSPGHPVTTAVLRTEIKETQCMWFVMLQGQIEYRRAENFLK
jgi:hypothetical protein